MDGEVSDDAAPRHMPRGLAAVAQRAPVAELCDTGRFGALEARKASMHRAEAPVALWKGASTKRLFDVAISSAGLIVLSPLLAVIAIVVVCTSRGPAIHFSRRVGRRGQFFMMPKFRTMLVSAPICPRESLAGRDQRLTIVGRFLRRTGLDELPQLVCVLRGEMSLIGPRPLLADDPGSAERSKFPAALNVRPGISGLAQVCGRNALHARQKARLDAFYARTASLGFDLAILVRTVGVIVSGRGFQ